ncbi:MAG: acetate--CoA ligase [Candidatus Aminicenantes bacterium RBG_16_63_16]|nr:MAG: acetate--CoA ligase [Candidatus Aminicenantes bacterium RBG_16_63_16]
MSNKQRKMTGEVFLPSLDVVTNAHIKSYEEMARLADKDLQAFWGARAEEFEWFKKWDKVLDDSNKPFYKWFVGGQTNIAYNCLDRHVKTWRRNKIALIWEGENGDLRTFSYHALNREVCKFSSVLKSMGVKKGDRVTIYMGRVPELPIAMLACAKIGAVHSVVYGGFSVEALHGRIEDSQSSVVITCDGSFMNGKIVELKKIVDEALTRAATVEHVVVYRRTGQDVYMEQGRDYWYHELVALPFARTGVNNPCDTEAMDAEDPLFLLYTSGTTGKPKAILHTHGGYMVGVATTLKWVFDLKEEDRWWCSADPGWITGHSYIVYAPLLLGATSFMYEGAPTYPYPNRWWSMIEKYGITVFYSTPTAIRGLMRFGEAWPNRHDLSSLRLLGTVGEPINPEAWKWYHRAIGKNRCPIMDTWWQTETGMFMITPLPVTTLKPGSATRPFPGVEAEVFDETGKPVKAGEEGFLVLKQPWPAMLRTIYGDPERYVDQYWSKYPGAYFTGDSARKDEDGYFWIIGRVDDVIKVSGYRLGTAEIESALVSHQAVAEAAVIGLPHEIKGQAIHAYVLLKQGHAPSEALAEELKQHVGHEMGPIAKPATITFVDNLPKTRSGKIMRRVLKARAQGLPEGDITTLEE